MGVMRDRHDERKFGICLIGSTLRGWLMDLYDLAPSLAVLKALYSSCNGRCKVSSRVRSVRQV